MIEALSERIIDRMISYKIIDNESRIVYGYNLQLIISSILGHLFILFVFGLTGKLFELLVFLIPFDALRMFCGGYHCNTIVGCLLFSFFICEMALALQNYIYPTLLLYQGGGILSMIFIIFVGAINHPNMRWSDGELKLAKAKSRKVTIVIGAVLLLLNYINAGSLIIYFYCSGVLYCALLLMIQMIMKGEETNEIQY